MQSVYGNSVAGEDLSTNNGRLVNLHTDGAVIGSVNGGQSFGLLMNKPTSGEPATVLVHGVEKAVAGDIITAGAVITSDADGRVITATTGTWPAGRALTAAGVAGQVINVFINSALAPLA